MQLSVGWRTFGERIWAHIRKWKCLNVSSQVTSSLPTIPTIIRGRTSTAGTCQPQPDRKSCSWSSTWRWSATARIATLPEPASAPTTATETSTSAPPAPLIFYWWETCTVGALHDVRDTLLLHFFCPQSNFITPFCQRLFCWPIIQSLWH